MSPPPVMDAETLHAKLRIMRELLDDLESVGDVTARQLDRERLTRHAIERVLTQLVALAVAINGHIAVARLGRAPSDYRDSVRLGSEAGAISADLAEQLSPSVGLRNVLTHEYAAIDLQIVSESVPLALKGFREYLREVADFLSAN